MKATTPLPGAGDNAACLEAAREAHLRYITDDTPGIRRIRHGVRFRYRDPNGVIITDQQTLERIRALTVPPAWTQVWICPNPAGHIQATGRDSKGRKQYRYHRRWRAIDRKSNRLNSSHV